MKNQNTYYNLTVLRATRVVTSYPFVGTKKAAIVEAKRLLETHVGAAVSVENKSGLVVGVCK